MNFNELPTPCYVVDEKKLINNLEILNNVADATGCHILLAQKAFSMYSVYPLIGQYLSGTTASGLYEARLGYEEMALKLPPTGNIEEKKETHIFSAAYRDDEFDEILKICDHIVFNSFSQLERYGERAKKSGKSIGIRINPECSTQEGHEIYDPCSPGSRLGVILENFDSSEKYLDLLDGIHFHTLCEQDSDALESTLDAVEEKFGKWLYQMNWLNFGGGHHITRPGYDIERLKKCIVRMRDKYSVQVYLEPGEAVALNAGYFITSILDVIKNGIDIAILDCSAACHMPDVLEMPYLPPLVGVIRGDSTSAATDLPYEPISDSKISDTDKLSPDSTKKEYTESDEYAVILQSASVEPTSSLNRDSAHTYRLGGMTCLAGDIIGDYKFKDILVPGDKLVFGDMAIYSMVKNNTFNGMPLPAIALYGKNKDCRIIKQFGYQDFKSRL